MYLITSFLYFISSSLDDELSALDFWYFCRRGDSTFTYCPLLYSFSLAARNLISLRYVIFEKFGESSTRRITTYVKCHLKLPPLLSPSLGSGSVTIPKIRPPFYLSSGLIPETPDLIAGLNNFTVVRQPIQQRSRHLLITKLRRPFSKGQIAYSDESEHLMLSST